MDFYKNYKQNMDGISLCISSGLIFPALTLIYSSIDIVSWMAFGNIQVEKRFIKWIDQWMYKNRTLDASSIDLYGARCSILHTLTPDSSLSKKGKANIVVYAWGKANIEDLKEVALKAGIENQSFVHLNDLFEIYKEGIDNFIADLDTDENLQKGFSERLAMSYDNMDNDELQSYRTSKD